MSLLNSSDPAIVAAQATVLETLAGIPDEYGAVFVIKDYQQELTNAVAAHHRREEERRQAERVQVRAKQMARKQRKATLRAQVVGLDGRRIA